jgi:two-component system, cell cycle sensor histidine kinase and response regulator CckA
MKPRPAPEQPAVGMADPLDGEGTVLKLTRQMSVQIGLVYLSALVTHLAEALKADCVFVGEFTPNSVTRVAILAASLESEQESPAFKLAGSVGSRMAVTGRPVLCRQNARSRFPSDPLLSRLRAEACIAVPLQDPAGTPIGTMMAVYGAPVASFRTAKSVLEAFAHRAAAELLHKQEKDRLRRSEQRYRAFVTLNHDAMWCADFDPPISTERPAMEQENLACQYGYLSECNDAAARLLGVDQCQQVVGRRIADLYPQVSPDIRNAIRDLIRSGYRFTISETSGISADGKRRFLLGSHMGIVENGMLQRVWGVTHDITDFKQVQQALDASQRRMIDLLEGVQLLVLILDRSASIQFCNNYFTQFTGWQSADVRHKDWLDLIPPEERADLRAEFERQVANPRTPTHFESTLLGPGGRRWQVGWDCTALLDEEGKVKAVAKVGRDITQDKAIEAHLRQIQKIESVGRLAGGIAHDFNNLLAVITGYTSHLLDHRSPADPDFLELNQIGNAADKAAQLTQQLLTFSRRRPHKPEAVRLNTIVERDSSMLGRTLGNNIGLVTNLDPSLGLVRADPGEISQVILNLAVNARDAMSGGGTLTITSSNASLSAEQGSVVPGVPEGEYVQLTINDTGTGMTQEVLDHLFEPFFTTKEPGKGTGLGLSIVYGIVRESGGYIKVKSEVGRGTSVRVFLPHA